MRRWGRRSALLLVANAGAALGLSACRAAPLPPADATYDTRGEVLQLPQGRDGELIVHHETVSSFRDRQGKPTQMDSMAMPFAVAPGVSLAGIAPGDKVAMTFEVRWKGEPTLRVVSLHGLPGDTALALGGPMLERVAPLGSSPAQTPAATPPPAADHPLPRASGAPGSTA